MENIKIYEVPTFIMEAMEASTDEDGNIDQDLYGDMVDLILGSEPVEKKLDGIRYHLLNIEQNRELAKNEHDRLEKTIKAYNSQEENLKRYIIEIMKVSNIDTIDTGTVVYKLTVDDEGNQDIVVEAEELVQRKFDGVIDSKDIVRMLVDDKGVIQDSELYDSVMSVIFEEKQSFPDRLNALRGVMLKYSSRHTLLKKEKKMMNDNGKIASERADKVKEIIDFVFKASNLEKLDTGICKFGFRKSSSIEVKDVSKLPTEFTRVKPAVVEPDKTALKKAMKSGQEFDGVTVIEKRNISMK